MKTLLDVFSSFKNRRKTAFVYKTGVRRLVFSYIEVYRLSLQMASLLEKEGIKKNDRVLLWAPNSPWWAIAFWGIVVRGAIVVPVDFMSGKDRAQTIAKLSKAKLIIQSQYKIDKLDGGILIEDLQFILEKTNPQALTAKPNASDIVELVYTSGTTGNPKGVSLTHKNLTTNIYQLDNHISITPSYNLLSVLPLSHMFEQMVGFLFPLYIGATIVYLRTVKPSALTNALKTENIYVIIAFPRLLLLLKRTIEQEFAAKGLGKVLAGLSFLSQKSSYSLKKKLFFPVHKKFGKNFQFFVSSGSALDPKVAKFWQNIGFTILEGYGLTECSPVLTANRRQKQVTGSVGKCVLEVKIKIKDREILAKGENIFKEYWQNTKATKDAFTNDGWFKTGDEGEIDKDGNVYIKGRKKELIVSSAGINVYPDEVELVLNNVKGIKESTVIGRDLGDGEEVHAVLLLDSNAPTPESIIQKANEKLDPLQHITSFSLWQQAEFPKTPTLKIQKFKVKEQLTKGGSEEKNVSTDKLIAFISNVSAKPSDQIKEKSLLASDLGITSLGRLELVNYIEQEYRLDLEDTIINQHTTVANLRSIVEKREKHDVPLRLSFYPNQPWARVVREAVNTLVHRPLFGIYINVRRVKGIQHLHKIKMPVIFITNHVSYLDYVAIAMALPRSWREKTAVATREEFFFEGNMVSRIRKRIMLEYMILMGNIFLLPQKRGFRKSLAFIGKLIDNNINIVLFPEGERSWDGKLLPFQAGLGIVVKELQAPVMPVKVTGMEKVFPRGSAFLKRGNVTVTFGKPIYFTTETPMEIVQKSREALMSL